MASLASWVAVHVAVVLVSHTGLNCASALGSNATGLSADLGERHYHRENRGPRGQL